MRTKEALALRKAEGVILGRKKGSITKLKILIDNELEIIDRLKKGESTESLPIRSPNSERFVQA